MKIKTEGNIFKLLVSGSTARVFLLFTNIATTFIMMPFLVRHLGDRQYGFWSIVGTVIGYFGYFDFGMSSAVSRFVSRAIGKGSQEETNTIISNAIRLFSLLSLIVCILSLSVAFVGQLFLPHGDKELFRDCIIILGIALAISFPGRAFAGALFAQLKNNLLSLSELAGVLFRFTFILYFIKNGYGLRTIAIISAISQLLSTSLTIFFFLATQKQFTFTKHNHSKTKELFSYSFITFTAQLAELIRFRLSPLIITANLGLAAVTIYNIADRLTDYFKQVIFSFLGTLAPVFSTLEGQNNSIELASKYRILTKVTSFFSLLFGCGIFIFGPTFIEVWMGSEYTEAGKYLQILSCSFTILLMNSTSGQLMYGISQHKYFAILTWIEAVANLGLTLILTRYMGLYGIVLGVSIPLVCIKGIIQPAVICKIIKTSIPGYFINATGIPLLAAGSYSFLFIYFTRNMIYPSYQHILSFGFIYLVFFIILMLPVSFNSDFAYIINKILPFVNTKIRRVPPIHNKLGQ